MHLHLQYCLNIQTSFLTPPFGFALFYLRGIAPAIVKTINMYKGVIPFIVLQIIAMVIVAKTPGLVNYLPNRVALLSENSPPPRNPQIDGHQCRSSGTRSTLSSVDQPNHSDFILNSSDWRSPQNDNRCLFPPQLSEHKVYLAYRHSLLCLVVL